MTGPAAGAVVALPPLWLGMVLAISFLEAPLKFRAPGVTIPLGLGIGRIVFRALNTVEVALAVLLLGACALGEVSRPTWLLAGAAAAVLAVQVGVVRPPLTARSNRILAGEDAPRSNLHFVYIALEVVKVAVLIALTVVALSAYR